MYYVLCILYVKCFIEIPNNKYITDMESAGLMQQLAYGPIKIDEDSLKKIMSKFDEYMQMGDSEFLKNNEDIVNFISANCFNIKSCSQNLVERLCTLNAEFYMHKLNLLYFSIVVNNKLIFDKMVEMDNLDIDEEVVSFAYHNKYMIDRLLRRKQIGNNSKNVMWEKFIYDFDKCYEDNPKNCEDLYNFYKDTCKVDLVSLLYIKNIKSFFDILLKFDSNLDCLNLEFKMLLRDGQIKTFDMCFEHLKDILTHEIINDLYHHLKNTIEYIKNKFKNQIIRVMDDKSCIKSDDYLTIVDDNYETVRDGTHIYDLFLVLEDNELFEEYCANSVDSINYEGNETIFATFLYDFDKYISDEFSTYFEVVNKLEKLISFPIESI